MSEHVWTQDNIAAYVAGGLQASEAERLEKHVADCAACARDIGEARSLEKKLAPLLLMADPGPALEDRIIQSLPPVEGRRWANKPSRKGKVVMAAAAAVLLAVLGAGVNALIERNGLGFPSALPFTMAKAPEKYRNADLDIIGGTEHPAKPIELGRRKALEMPDTAPISSADDLAKEIRDQTLAPLRRTSRRLLRKRHRRVQSLGPTYGPKSPRLLRIFLCRPQPANQCRVQLLHVPRAAAGVERGEA